MFKPRHWTIKSVRDQSLVGIRNAIVEGPRVDPGGESVEVVEASPQEPRKTPLCGTCQDHEGVICDLCGNGLVPESERRVPFRRAPDPVAPPEHRLELTKARIEHAAGKAVAEWFLTHAGPGPMPQDSRPSAKEIYDVVKFALRTYIEEKP